MKSSVVAAAVLVFVAAAASAENIIADEEAEKEASGHKWLSSDARDAIGAQTGPESRRDITFGGVGVALDF